MLSKNDLSTPGTYPVFSSETTNNGIIGKTNLAPEFIINEHKPYYVTFGDHTRSFNIAKESFSVTDNVKVLLPIERISLNAILFIVSTWKKCIINKGYARHWSIAKNVKFKLPCLAGAIDFEFMENFIAELNVQRIAELNAYLTVTGLKDYELTEEERETIERYNLKEIEIKNYMFSQVFNKIKQGRRLKKEDQKEGDIPFVMSGVTNMGVVGYVSNPVASFKRNSITIDIFGNAFYRNYDFGAGDDTGVYWSDKEHYSENTMLFFTTAMGKALNGKYSYGKKLRSSQSLELNMKLPTRNKDIDIKYVEVFISAIKKLVIKDVALWADKKIEATKQVANRN